MRTTRQRRYERLQRLDARLSGLRASRPVGFYLLAVACAIVVDGIAVWLDHLLCKR